MCCVVLMHWYFVVMLDVGAWRWWCLVLVLGACVLLCCVFVLSMRNHIFALALTLG
jgi:hypothetical protein